MYILLKKNHFTQLTLEFVNSLYDTNIKYTLHIGNSMSTVTSLDHLVDLYVII
jgi:hypothetical protein